MRSLTTPRLMPSGYVARLMEYLVTSDNLQFTLDELRTLFGKVPVSRHRANMEVLRKDGWMRVNGDTYRLTAKAVGKYFCS